jgi:NAD-dependent deacetylase
MNNRKKIVVLSGAGLDKESGIETFRDSKDSLWNNHRVEDVATPMAFLKDPSLVLEFYNQRRRQLAGCSPNQAHYDLVALEDYYDVFHITQNVSDLLEKAGSSNVLHLHGSLTEAKTNMSPDKIYDIGYEDVNLGDVDDDGYQLRPDVVFFGESVPAINDAERITRAADIYIIIGTSLGVYPAAGLHRITRKDVPIYIIDPNVPEGMIYEDRVKFYQEAATSGVARLVGELIEKALEE